MKIEILYGIHPVTEALKAGRRDIFEIYVVGDKTAKRFAEALALAEFKKIPIKKTSSPWLESAAKTHQHQGIGAKVGAYPLIDISRMTDACAAGDSDPFVLVLDQVVDPHNLGALVRTALCAGVGGIVLSKDRSASPTPAVSRASAGALEHILLTRVVNVANTLDALKEKGLWVVGMDRDADRSVFSGDLSGPIAVVIGGEEKGIRPLVKKHCDFLLSIPQSGQVNSLNASVAGAVVMYEAFRQRELKRKGVLGNGKKGKDC